MFFDLFVCFKEGDYYSNNPANLRDLPESQRLRFLGLLKHNVNVGHSVLCLKPEARTILPRV